MQERGGETINRLIREAVSRGEKTLTIRGEYEIEAPILLPSDFTLVLEDAYLRMGKDTFCNMFLNEHARTTREEDRNITLLGRGRSVLDGGEYNGLGERNAGKDGRPFVDVNNLLLFVNVDGFVVENLRIQNQRWWALNFMACRNGRIRDLDFLSSADYRLPDGSIVRGYPEDYDYEAIIVKNQDGIDLRKGCHDILIENISGFVEDDMVALTNLDGAMEERFRCEGQSEDIYNVTIRSVRAASLCSIIRLLDQSKNGRMYNVLIEGIFDSSKDCPWVARAHDGVRIGDNHMYGKEQPRTEQVSNITVRDIYMRSTVAFSMAGAMRDCRFTGIYGFDGNKTLISNTAITENVIVEP